MVLTLRENRRIGAGNGIPSRQTGQHSLRLRIVISTLNEALYSQGLDPPPKEEDYRTRFYEVYRREADEYDREFIKRYDEDLNTTLIFVRCLRPSSL